MILLRPSFLSHADRAKVPALHKKKENICRSELVKRAGHSDSTPAPASDPKLSAGADPLENDDDDDYDDDPRKINLDRKGVNAKVEALSVKYKAQILDTAGIPENYLDLKVAEFFLAPEESDVFVSEDIFAEHLDLVQVIL